MKTDKYTISISNLLSYKSNPKRDGYYDQFWERLADRLMLDELLAGEANPRDFLKEQVFELCKEIKIEVAQEKIDDIKRT